MGNSSVLGRVVLLCVLVAGCSKDKVYDTPDEDPGPVEVPGWSGPPPAQGYLSRACGFDLNDDGVVGSGQDCQVCDGVTTDPDGDGVDEDLIYIDCDLGADTADCGDPQNPCATISYAWNDVADGAADGAEDILCFRGTCTEGDVSPGVSGLATSVVEPRAGSAGRDFELPADPTMVVGWDSDGDGEYPPFDTDDVAVLDGGPEAREYVFTGLTSYVELAHFEVRNYGRYNDTQTGGFVRLKRGSAETTHLHVHDLVLANINREREHVSDRVTFNFFGGTNVRHLMFRNLDVPDNGGYFARGASPCVDGLEDGPFRWQNVSLTAHGCDNEGPGACEDVNLANHTGWKIWGWATGIEILDSVFDANTDNWIPKSIGGPPTNLIVANLCSRDWLIRNNLIINYKNVLAVDGYEAGYCDNEAARTVDDVVLDGNIYYNDFMWGWGHHLVIIGEGGDSPGETIEDVTITNNFFYSASPQLESCFYLAGGNSAGPNPGTISVVNNTCVSPSRRFGLLVIGNPDSGDDRFPHQHYIILNNILSGLGADAGQANVRATYAPDVLEMDGNVYDPAGVFVWLDDTFDTLADWSAATGGDGSSSSCVPTFVDLAMGDLHLAAGDTCGLGGGVDGSAVVTTDLDGEDRPQSDWDSGADERD